MVEGAGTRIDAGAVSSAWQSRCRAAGLDAGLYRGPQPDRLVSALLAALDAGLVGPGLKRAASEWGALATSGAQVLDALSLLQAAVEAATAVHSTALGQRRLAETLERLVQVAKLEAMGAMSEQLRRQARTDPLTGAANRLALQEDLPDTVARSARAGGELTVAAVDLVGLKRINDSRGHVSGDAALRALAAKLRSSFRSTDALYRTGGDEFLVLSPFTDASGAMVMLERAQRTEGPAFSWGVATLTQVGSEALDDPWLLVAAADADLYARRRAAAARRRPALVVTALLRRPAVAGVAAAATLALVGTVGAADMLIRTPAPAPSVRAQAPRAHARVPSTRAGGRARPAPSSGEAPSSPPATGPAAIAATEATEAVEAVGSPSTLSASALAAGASPAVPPAAGAQPPASAPAGAAPVRPSARHRGGAFLHPPPRPHATTPPPWGPGGRRRG